MHRKAIYLTLGVILELDDRIVLLSPTVKNLEPEPLKRGFVYEPTPEWGDAPPRLREDVSQQHADQNSARDAREWNSPVSRDASRFKAKLNKIVRGGRQRSQDSVKQAIFHVTNLSNID
jgi:hypothetical protein